MGYGPDSIPRLRCVVRATLILQVGVTLIVASVLLASRGKLGYLFTDDKVRSAHPRTRHRLCGRRGGRDELKRMLPFRLQQETRHLISRTLIPMATYQLTDGLQGAGAGILRATGRQDLAAAIRESSRKLDASAPR